MPRQLPSNDKRSSISPENKISYIADISAVTRISYNTLLKWQKRPKSDWRGALFLFFVNSSKKELRDIFGDVYPPKGQSGYKKSIADIGKNVYFAVPKISDKARLDKYINQCKKLIKDTYDNDFIPINLSSLSETNKKIVLKEGIHFVFLTDTIFVQEEEFKDDLNYIWLYNTVKSNKQNIDIKVYDEAKILGES